MYKLWVNVDDQGNIISTYGGHENYIVDPTESYDYYFETNDVMFKDIGSYRVVDGELIRK